jgi:hypothetical protein
MASARASRAGPALTATSPQQQTSAVPTRTAALVACAMVLLACATVREATAGRSASRAGAGRRAATRAQPRATSMLRATATAGAKWMGHVRASQAGEVRAVTYQEQL